MSYAPLDKHGWRRRPTRIQEKRRRGKQAIIFQEDGRNATAENHVTDVLRTCKHVRGLAETVRVEKWRRR